MANIAGKHGLKWLIVTLFALFTGYLVVLMYAQGEVLFAALTLIVLSVGLVIFAQRRATAWRYVYPGLAGMALFVLFPLAATIAISFTNYSSTNQLTFERAQTVLLDRQYQAGERYNFNLWPQGSQWVLQLTADGKPGYLSEPFSFDDKTPQTLALKESAETPQGERALLRVVTQNRQALGLITATLPDGSSVRMSSLRQFSGTQPLYKLAADGSLTNQQTGTVYWPNDEVGFYQAKDANQQWSGERLSPGYTVSIGWKNFLRVMTDDGIQKPFIGIFIWTVVFALLTVILTTAVGMVLACLMQWEALKGRAVYRLLLILPYAVPAFISILIFKGLFNQSFGEINIMLNALFGDRKSACRERV